MKFTKTAVALAIAGIAAAPMMASADTTLSGIIQINMEGSDLDDDPATPDTTEGDLTLTGGDVRVTVVSEHELNSGLTGYGGVRFDFDGLSNDANGLTGDSIHAGIKGGFGDLRLGEGAVPVEYGQTANDIYDVAADNEQAVTYTGDFGPVGLALNWSPENNQDRVGAGVKFGLGGFNIGLGFENDSADNDNIAAGVSFAYAGASIAGHFWTREAGENDLESLSVKAGYGFGGVDAAVTFSTLTLDDADEQAIRLDLGYGLGGGTKVSTRITSFSGDEIENAEQVQYRVQLEKTF